MHVTELPARDLEAQRRGIRRTVLIASTVAIALFAWTVWSLVHGR